MIKVKDGYAKLIGTTYQGSVDRVLLSNGGDKIIGNASGNIPINNGTVNVNLNVDMLDGKHSDSFIQTNNQMIKGTGGRLGGYHGETGWHRIATINNGDYGYSSFILYLCGIWSFSANTSAILHINTRNTTAAISQISGIVGYADKIRLVNISKNKFYVDIHINYTDNPDKTDDTPGIIWFYFLGNGAVEINTTVEKITEEVTASAEITLVHGGKITNANYAERIYVNQHTSSDTEYPLVWSNQTNQSTIQANQLYKSYSNLTYNPKHNRITATVFKTGSSTFIHGTLELYGNTPYIDFHYNNSTSDYTSRIIEGLEGQLTVTGKLRVGLDYTTSTDYKLHVNGSAYATNFVSGSGINDFSSGTVKLDILNIPTSSGGTTYGPGTAGQVLKSNGTSVYWANDNNTTYQLYSKEKATPTTAGWYRIAQSVVNVGNCFSTFELRAQASGIHTITKFIAGTSYNRNDGTYIAVLNASHYDTIAIQKIRIVYKANSYPDSYAYVEVYKPSEVAVTINVKSVQGFGWTLLDPNTAGSIPSGYTSKEVTLKSGYLFTPRLEVQGEQKFYGLTSTANAGNDSSYQNAALEIREYNFGGEQTADWGIAPRLSWHWGSRCQAQLGMYTDADLYFSKNQFTNAYKLVYQDSSKTWGINISGNASTATSAKTFEYTTLPSSSANAANTVWCKFARIAVNTGAYVTSSGYLFFGGLETSNDYKGILYYHFRSSSSATTISSAVLRWLVKSDPNMLVIAVKVEDCVYDLYIRNISTYQITRISRMSIDSRFTWSVGTWSTTKPTEALHSIDEGRVNYSNAMYVPRVAKTCDSVPGLRTLKVEEYTSGADYNLPSSHYYHIYSAQGVDSTFATQLAIGMTTKGLYHRIYAASTWEKWVKVIDSRNYVAYTPILNSSSTHATNSSVIYAPTTAGTSGQVLKSNGSGAPTWVNPSTLQVNKAKYLYRDSNSAEVAALPYYVYTTLNSEYGTTGSETTTYLKNYLKKLVSTHSDLGGLTLIGRTQPNSQHVSLFRAYSLTDYEGTGLPQHSGGLSIDIGGSVYSWGTSNGVFRFSTLVRDNITQTITGLKTFECNSGTTGIALKLRNSSWTGGMSTAMDFYNGSDYTVPNARIETKMVGDGKAGGTLIFYTQTKHASANPNTNGLVERLRIDDNGTTKVTGAFTTTGNITGANIIKSGGTSSQFLKADGSVDSNTYAAASSLSNYVTLNTTQTITGYKNFSSDGVAAKFSSSRKWCAINLEITNDDSTKTRGYLILSGDSDYRLSNSDWTTEHKILHSGNSSVSGGGSEGGSSITVKINNTSKTLTIPTSLPANGGTSTYTNYLNVHDIRDSSYAPNNDIYPHRSITGWFNQTGNPTSTWYSGITVKGWSHNYGVWQLCSYSSDGNTISPNLYFRQGEDSTWQDWRTILDSSNYKSTIGDGTYWKVNGQTTVGTGEIYLELWRGTAASWKMINTNGILKFQCNYTTTAGTYYDALTIAYSSGNVTAKGNVTASKFIGTLNSTLTFSVGTFAAKTYNNSAAVTVNIPTKTSHLTNDSGYLTSRGYIGTTTVQASSATQGLTGISSINMSGRLTINTTITDHSNPTAQCLVINSAAVPEGTTLTTKNAPGIGFHISKTTWGSLVLTNGLFSFVDGVNEGYMAVKASRFISGDGTNDFSAGVVKFDTLNIPTTSGGSTYGAGTNGQVLKSNGTTVYWASDTDTKVTQTATTTNADLRILLSGNANDTTETTSSHKSTSLKFNPNTGVITHIGSINSSKNDASNVQHSCTNTNGGIAILTSSNRGLYDTTKGQWVIGTNGTNTWASQGNFGIGTTAPTYKLHVSGTGYFNNTLTCAGTTQANRFYLRRTGATGVYADIQINTIGTADTAGITYLLLGNGTASGTAENAQGVLRIYGTSSGYTNIRCGTNNTSAYTLYLPGDSGQFVYHTNDTAVGDSNNPVYVTEGGKVTKGSAYAGGTKVTLNGEDKGASTASLYAPTSGGTAGYVLKSNGTSAPTWIAQSSIAAGSATTATKAGYITSGGKLNSSQTYGKNDDKPTGLRFYEIYQNGYPFNYGNLLHINGAAGISQLACEWNGSGLAYRSCSDVGLSFNNWVTIITSDNISDYVGGVDLSSYLPLTGGTMTGSITMDNASKIVLNNNADSTVGIIYKQNRTTISNTWANAIINITNASDTSLGQLGIYGYQANMDYIYLGMGSYNGNSLRIGSDYVQFGSNDKYAIMCNDSFRIKLNAGTIKEVTTGAGILGMGTSAAFTGSYSDTSAVVLGNNGYPTVIRSSGNLVHYKASIQQQLPIFAGYWAIYEITVGDTVSFYKNSGNHNFISSVSKSSNDAIINVDHPDGFDHYSTLVSTMGIGSTYLWVHRINHGSSQLQYNLRSTSGNVTTGKFLIQFLCIG